ncbi:MAG: ATP-grasp domain-containing protein [Candidatus Hydrothermarchaeales archaeon]
MRAENTVFLFEYATCTTEELPAKVAVEGVGMFKTLFDGFERPVSFYRHPNYLDAFREYLERSEFVLAIAPETDMELYRLTKLIEDSDCRNLGSNSKAVKLASDKLLTYKRLGNLVPKTELFKGTTSLDFPLIAKPRDGVSCDGVMLVRNEDELKEVPHGYLVQEYMPGRPMSASVIVGEEARIISINTQELVGFEYLGAKLPLNHSNTEEIIEAVTKVHGLFGYIGVDFVLADGRPVIIEINPRPTTPIIGLNTALGINVSELILKNYKREKIPRIKPEKTVQIKKTRSNSGFVSHDGYSIEIEEIHEDIDL